MRGARRRGARRRRRARTKTSMASSATICASVLLCDVFTRTDLTVTCPKRLTPKTYDIGLGCKRQAPQSGPILVYKHRRQWASPYLEAVARRGGRSVTIT
eukprot:3925272-Amphidinium_carterae.1